MASSTTPCPQSDSSPLADKGKNKMQGDHPFSAADREVLSYDILGAREVNAMTINEKHINDQHQSDTTLSANQFSRMESTVDAIYAATEVLRKLSLVVTDRLDEMDKKQDIMVWKLAKIETISDSGKGETVEDLKLRSNVIEKSSGDADKAAMSAPSATPRRYYNRKSPTTAKQPHKKPTNSCELSDECDGKFSRERVRGKSNLGENTILRPTTSNKSSLVQSGGRPDQLKRPNNNSNAHNTSFCIGLQPVGTGVSSQNSSMPNVVRNLSFIETPTHRPGKAPKIDADSKETPAKRAKSKDNKNRFPTPTSDEEIEPWVIGGHVLPLRVQSMFRPTSDMALKKEQVEVVAYVFYPDYNATEVIFKMGYTEGTRQDFHSLCPGNKINSKIVNWMAMKATWMQNKITEQTTWSLPPSFAQDVKENSTVGDLLETYAKEWMKPYKELKYIYVPIQEYGGHWYLMVMCLEDQVIYHLDSHLTDETTGRRRDLLKLICNVIIQMMESSYFPHNYVKQVIDGENWDIMQGKGVPNCGHSFNSVIWVLQWMDMEYAFQPNLVKVTLDEPFVRMRVAIELLIGHHNECRDTLESKATAFYKTIT